MQKDPHQAGGQHTSALFHSLTLNSLDFPQALKEFIRVDVEVYIVSCDGESQLSCSDKACTVDEVNNTK